MLETIRVISRGRVAQLAAHLPGEQMLLSCAFARTLADGFWLARHPARTALADLNEPARGTVI